jgi:predicted dehydrogenase
MHPKINVGIAGYGIVGKKRHECINKNQHMNLVAVCDHNYETSSKFDDGIYFYPDYNDLLDHGIDALFVCLTNDVAAEVTIAGLNSGIHVFCEKPPGQNPQQISEVIKTENKHKNLKLKYGFNHRYHESVKDAFKIINSEELGKIVDLNAVYGKSKIITATGPNADWRSRREIAGGGILLDQGIHMVDLIRYFSGDFEEVYSFISNNYWKYDVEDNAYAIMRTADGKVAVLQSSATQWRHDFSLHVTLEKGSIILKGILSGTKSYGAETLTVAYKAEDESGDPKEKTIRYNHDPSWEDEVNEFAEAIVNDSPINSGTSDDAYKTMDLVYRIYCADSTWVKKYNLKA